MQLVPKVIRKVLLGIAVTVGLGFTPTAYAGPFEDGDAAYFKGDYPAAARLYKLAADQGDAAAQTNLGLMYDHGQGVTQNYQEAVRLYKLAVDQGYALAQSNLGGMYYKGTGVTQNKQEAARLLKLAADQGVAAAQNNLGAMYGKGEGVTQNYQEAVRLFKLAADQGYAFAQGNLGRMYYNGQGVTQDYILAHMWFNLAVSSLEGPDGKNATTSRNLVAVQMTPAQIERAQSMARVCQASNFKTCGY